MASDEKIETQYENFFIHECAYNGIHALEATWASEISLHLKEQLRLDETPTLGYSLCAKLTKTFFSAVFWAPDLTTSYFYFFRNERASKQTTIIRQTKLSSLYRTMRAAHIEELCGKSPKKASLDIKNLDDSASLLAVARSKLTIEQYIHSLAGSSSPSSSLSLFRLPAMPEDRLETPIAGVNSMIIGNIFNPRQSWGWLYDFPDLRKLRLWHLHLTAFPHLPSFLEELTIAECSGFNQTMLFPISHSSLKSVIIDSVPTPIKAISDWPAEEARWERNDTVEIVALGMEVAIDIIMLLCQSLRNLKYVTLTPHMLDNIVKNTSSGSLDGDPIVFRDSSARGHVVRRPIKFYNLVRHVRTDILMRKTPKVPPPTDE